MRQKKLFLLFVSLFVSISVSFVFANTCDSYSSYCSGATIVNYHEWRDCAWCNGGSDGGYCGDLSHTTSYVNCADNQYCSGATCYNLAAPTNECMTIAGHTYVQKADGTACHANSGVCKTGTCLTEVSQLSAYPTLLQQLCTTKGGAYRSDAGCCGFNKPFYEESFDSSSLSAAYSPTVIPTTVNFFGTTFLTGGTTLGGYNVKNVFGNWEVWFWKALFSSSYMILSTDPVSHAGSKNSIRMDFLKSDADFRIQKSPMLPPGQYTVFVWVKAQNFVVDQFTNVQSPQWTGKINIHTQAGYEPSLAAQSEILNGTYDWKRINFTLNVPSTQEYAILLGSSLGFSSGTIWFDDLKIIKTSFGETGEIGNITGAAGNFICLNSPTWNWKKADDNAFKVISVNGLYDIVSNGQKWFACNSTNAASSLPSSTFTLTGLLRPTPGVYIFDPNASTSVTPGGIPDGGSLGGNGQTKFDSLDQDLFSSGLSIPVVVPIFTHNSTAVDSAFFELSNVVDGKFKLRASHLPSGAYKIRNLSGLEIKAISGTSSYSTEYAEQTSVGSVLNEFIVQLPSSVGTGVYSLNVTFLDSSNSVYKTYSLMNVLFVDSPVISQPGASPYKISAGRFLCSDVVAPKSQKNGLILECCGSSYDYCINKNNKPTTRVAGGTTSLLKDHYGSDNSKNGVLRISFPANLVYSEYGYQVSDFPIANWTKYSTLEFDILFTGSQKLNLLVSGTNGPIYNTQIMLHSINGNETNQWHHIRIPLTNSIKNSVVSSVKFYINGSVLNDDVKENLLQIAGSPDQYLMIFGLDRIVLGGSPTEQFCLSDFNIPERNPLSLNFTLNPDWLGDASVIGGWVTDLDFYSNANYNAKDACNNVPGYTWTGTQCCGDDQGISGKNETYYDTNAGCWNGKTIPNNSLVTVGVPR